MRTLIARLWHSPTFTTWASLATRLLSIVLVLPLVLIKFTPPEIAVWQLFASVTMLQTVIDFGFGPTFSRLVAYARGGASISDLAAMSKPRAAGRSGDRNETTLLAVVDTLRVVYKRLTIVWFTLLAVVGTIALLKPMSHIPDSREAWLAWGVMVPGMVVGFWGGSFGNILQGLNRIALMRRWDTFFSLAQIVATSLVLFLGGGLLALALATQVWALFNAWRNRRFVQQLEPALLPPGHTPALDPRIFSVLWPAAWRSGLGIIMSYGVVQSSGILYSQFAPSAKDLAAYLLALRAINIISQFSQAPFYSKLPGLAHSYTLNDHAALVRNARRGMRLSHTVMLAGIIGVLLFVQPLLTAIGSQVHFVSPTLWLTIALAFFVERYGAMHLQLYSLTNDIVWHVAAGVTGVLMVTFSWLLFPLLGIYALPIGMLLGHLSFYTWYSASHSFKAFGLRFLSFEGTTCIPQLLCLLLALTVSTTIQL